MLAAISAAHAVASFVSYLSKGPYAMRAETTVEPVFFTAERNAGSHIPAYMA